MRRRVGSISLAGITGPEELELLEEEAQCESEVFVIFHHLCVVCFLQKAQWQSEVFAFFNHLYQDDLYESKVMINPERFNFLHF